MLRPGMCSSILRRLCPCFADGDLRVLPSPTIPDVKEGAGNGALVRLTPRANGGSPRGGWIRRWSPPPLLHPGQTASRPPRNGHDEPPASSRSLAPLGTYLTTLSVGLR